jgi:SAM-dependent methyltransferase
MSVFSSVDAGQDPDRALGYLDWTARAESGMKQYATAAHALRSPVGPILDVGCGAGHDLSLLASAGLRAVGVDPSATLLRSAGVRTQGSGAGLVRAAGEMLPFGTGTFAGCRIERVLMHVVDPAVVLAEAVRCLRPGALITVFEPDWSSYVVRNDGGDQPAGWVAGMANPSVGRDLPRLLAEVGCDVLDRVEEDQSGAASGCSTP